MVNIITILMKSLGKLPLKIGLSSFLLMSLLLFGSMNVQAKEKTYGPVRSGQTLWVIAYRTRLRGVSRLRMMKALHRYNPKAFDRNNINRLKRGARLKIPTSRRHVNRILSSKKSTSVVNKTATIVNKVATIVDEAEPAPTPTTDLANITDKKLIVRLQKDLIAIKKDLLESKETLQTLKSQEVQLEQARQSIKIAQEHQTEMNAQLASLTAQYTSAQQKIKQLQQANKALLANKADPVAQSAMSVELGALKKQNSLLRQELKESVAAATNSADADAAQVQFKETVTALNADISLLKNRINELESIEKLKDNHITQLQQSLDRATVVIKNQAVTNKQIFEQLSALASAQKRQQTPTTTTPVITTASSVVPVKQLFPIKSNTQIAADTPFSLSQITPRFWLIITLSVLLLVLALLWRQMFPKENIDSLA